MNIIGATDLDKVTYPCFRLPKPEYTWSGEELDLYNNDGVVFYEGKVLDDKNIKSSSLGIRRLKTPFPEESLVPLKKAAKTKLAIVKSAAGYYIDSKGLIFKYEKTKFLKLKYTRIKKVERKDTYSLLWLFNELTPIKIPRPPPAEMSWAGFLYLGPVPWLLYEYSEIKKPDTRRKV